MPRRHNATINTNKERNSVHISLARILVTSYAGSNIQGVNVTHQVMWIVARAEVLVVVSVSDRARLNEIRVRYTL